MKQRSRCSTRSASSIYGRNRELADLPEANRSTIVSVSLGEAEGAALPARLQQRNVVCSVRDGNLRLAMHFYNHEDDIDRLAGALVRP